jgi:hypothetical protein
MNDDKASQATAKGVEDNGPTLSGDPDRELELKLKKNPQDPDRKTDVGSDESMDASDPISATQPGGNEPAPSSGFPAD